MIFDNTDNICVNNTERIAENLPWRHVSFPEDWQYLSYSAFISDCLRGPEPLNNDNSVYYWDLNALFDFRHAKKDKLVLDLTGADEVKYHDWTKMVVALPSIERPEDGFFRYMNTAGSFEISPVYNPLELFFIIPDGLWEIQEITIDTAILSSNPHFPVKNISVLRDRDVSSNVYGIRAFGALFKIWYIQRMEENEPVLYVFIHECARFPYSHI